MRDRSETQKILIEQMENIRRMFFERRFRNYKDDQPTPAQVRILDILSKENNLSVSEISERLNITSSAATQLIDPLVNKGLLVRKEDSSDRRRYIIEVSRKASLIIKVFKRNRIKKFEKLTKVLTDEELEQLTNILSKLINNEK